MNMRNGVLVLVIQVLLVLSIGAKYAWERHHCPMVWAKAVQFDPEQPLRGRYLAIGLYASACGLPMGDATSSVDHPRISPTDKTRWWTVVPAVRNGVLTPVVVENTRPGPTQQLWLETGAPCEAARLSGSSDYFIPEHAKSPFPLQKGQQLWALVTVPPSGPVRPVKLAVSDSSGFHVLNLD